MTFAGRFTGITTRRGVAAVAAAALVCGAGATVTASQAQAATGCSVTYAIQSQWPGGFQGGLVLTEVGDPLTSWTLTWSFTGGQQISQAWGATVAQTGAQVSASNLSWNGAVPTGGTVSLGFIASWTGSSNPVPASFAVNGVTCTGGTTTTTTTRPVTTTTTTTTRPVTTSTTTTTSPVTTTTTTTTGPATGLLTQVNTAGRVRDNGTSLEFTWPGVYFEGRFHGTGVGIVLNDSNNDYDVQVDGATVASLVTPGQTTYWVNNLTDADHTVRLVKRTESPWASGQFGGFVAAPGGTILAKAAARTRQIEFIGDSYTAGYGNMSTTRDCSSNGGVTRNSDADQSFGALTARTLGADYQINAWSGMGMVRNYGGNYPDLSFRSYYLQTLQAVWNSTPFQSATWKPQVVVVGLGINDFSTALNSNEKWANSDALVADYKSAYQGFLDTLRAQYGADTTIVVSATAVSGTTLFADSAQQVVKDRNAKGDTKVVYWYYDDPTLDHLGCDWHPSQHDDKVISGLLNNYLATLSLKW